MSFPGDTVGTFNFTVVSDKNMDVTAGQISSDGLFYYGDDSFCINSNRLQNRANKFTMQAFSNCFYKSLNIHTPVVRYFYILEKRSCIDFF